MNRVLITAAARTPVARIDGQLKNLTEQELAARAMGEALRRAKLGNGSRLDEIIVGVARQTSLPSNCARHAALLCNIPEEVPAYTVQLQGASGLQAIINGFLAIRCGAAQMVLAGGTESASQMPAEILNARYHFAADTEIIFDPLGNQQIYAQPPELYGKLTLADMVSEVAGRYNIQEETMRRFIENSGEKLRKYDCGAERVPVETRRKKMLLQVEHDDLGPNDGYAASFGDGAAMCVLADSRVIAEQGGSAMAEILSAGLTAAFPCDVCEAAAAAAKKALKASSLSISDLDFVEIHELSAAHAIAIGKRLNLPKTEKPYLNPQGGALAQGNPWGAAGAILVGRAAHRLARREARRGMVVMPAEGGQGLAVILQAWDERGR